MSFGAPKGSATKQHQHNRAASQKSSASPSHRRGSSSARESSITSKVKSIPTRHNHHAVPQSHHQQQQSSQSHQQKPFFTPTGEPYRMTRDTMMTMSMSLEENDDPLEMSTPLPENCPASYPLSSLQAEGAVPRSSELCPDSYDALAVMERINHTRRILESMDVERAECKRNMERGKELHDSSGFREWLEKEEARVVAAASSTKKEAAKQSSSTAINNSKKNQQQQAANKKKYASAVFDRLVGGGGGGGGNNSKQQQSAVDKKPSSVTRRKVVTALSASKRSKEGYDDDDHDDHHDNNGGGDRHHQGKASGDSFSIPTRFVDPSSLVGGHHDDVDAPVIVRTALGNSNAEEELDYSVVTYSSPDRLPPGKLQSQYQNSMMMGAMMMMGARGGGGGGVTWRLPDPEMETGDNLSWTASMTWAEERRGGFA